MELSSVELEVQIYVVARAKSLSYQHRCGTHGNSWHREDIIEIAWNILGG